MRIRLKDFTRVDALSLDLGENFLSSAVIDPSGSAYFGTATTPGIVVKVGVPRFPTTLVSVVVGSDGQLYSSTFNGFWSAWIPLGRSSPSTPALCASAGGRVDLVVRGTDN